MKKVLLTAVVGVGLAVSAMANPYEDLMLSKWGINGTYVTATAAQLNGTAAMNGSALTNLTAANITAGGSITAINGAAITNLTAANIKAGGSITAINGSAITNLTAANISPAAVTRTLTNIVWDAGSTTGTITIVNGRITAITP